MSASFAGLPTRFRQAIVVQNPTGNSIYANQATLDYTPKDGERCGRNRTSSRTGSSNWETTWQKLRGKRRAALVARDSVPSLNERFAKTGSIVGS